MPGPERDLVGYGRRPPAVGWPGGARVAVSLVLNYEEGSERTTLVVCHEIPSRYALNGAVGDIAEALGGLDHLVANAGGTVGGNLAEILDTISYTIRERVRIKGEIRVMTSQVLYSGRFLAMMPLLIAGVLFLLNRSYMMEFFNPETRVIGITLLCIGGGMIGAGYFVMIKIATIDV